MNKYYNNVLLIMADQHRSNYMNGEGPVPTPNIDRIAKRGLTFKNAFCAYPVCLASRCSMLTGLYAHKSGAVNNTDFLDRRIRTAAHHFSAAGYYTGLIGKMHFNDSCNHGYEFYTSINDWLMYLGPKASHYADEIASHQLAEHFFHSVYDDGAGFPDLAGVWEKGKNPWIGNVTRYEPGQPVSKLDSCDHMDAFFARETCKFLEKHGGQPFFLTVSFMKPHTPFFPPAEYSKRYPHENMVLQDAGDLSQHSSYVRGVSERYSNITETNRKSAKAGYYANLAFADDCIGEVLDAVERLGLAEKTIIVYTSDHGEMDGDHGLYQKFCMFDPSVKVPFIISHPGKIAENAVTDRLVSQVGLYPTLAELTGTAPVNVKTLAPMQNAPSCIDGASFAKKINDYSLKDDADETVFAEFAISSERSAQYMIRGGRYKFVHYGTGECELFDLEADPGEKINLAAKGGYGNKMDEMKQKIEKIINRELNANEKIQPSDTNTPKLIFPQP